jgi:CRISPR/Cas system CSM-associated protein Csm3 (group 7 of RAMP superfamily)
MIRLAELNQQTTLSENLTLTAVIDTALCVGAGGSSGSLADKPILKNADGKLVIPASQVKGRLRHECEKLVRALGWPICESPVAETMCPQRTGVSGNFQRSEYHLRDAPRQPDGSPQRHCLICQLFGNPTLPSRLQFSDLVCIEHPDNIPEVLRPGVTINRRRRTAEDQKLYFLETSPANVGLKFEGKILLRPRWKLAAEFETESPDFARALLLAGLHHIHALGGSKSTGLGWLHWEFADLDLSVPNEVWDWLGRGTVTSEKPSSGGDA